MRLRMSRRSCLPPFSFAPGDPQALPTRRLQHWHESRGQAGQTVFHLHVHVIPHYSGDVADPRGGVRHVIPAKANYLARAADPETPVDLPHPQALIRGGEDPFLPHLRESLDRARDADIAVAFVLESGVRSVIEHLRDLLDRGGRGCGKSFGSAYVER